MVIGNGTYTLENISRLVKGKDIELGSQHDKLISEIDEDWLFSSLLLHNINVSLWGVEKESGQVEIVKGSELLNFAMCYTPNFTYKEYSRKNIIIRVNTLGYTATDFDRDNFLALVRHL